MSSNFTVTVTIMAILLLLLMSSIATPCHAAAFDSDSDSAAATAAKAVAATMANLSLFLTNGSGSKNLSKEIREFWHCKANQKKRTRNSDQDCLSWINPQFFWVPNGDASDSSSAWWQHAKHPIGNCKEHCTFRLQRTSKNTESHEELLWFVKLATAKRMISEVIGLILVQKDVSTTLDKIQKRSMRVLYKSQKGYHGFNQIITQF